MHTRSVFMRDQVHHRVQSIMTERRLPAGHGAPGTGIGGPLIVAVVVLLTILNVLAVAPPA